MHARAIDDAGSRLRELRREEWQDLALAGAALGLALVATRGAPALALPLFVGGLAVGVLGIRAIWRHWDLVDRLADEPDAYSISEVRVYAAREATMDRRRTFAALIRHRLEARIPDDRPRLEDAAGELVALADELEDESLELRPECAVACSRLLLDPAQSSLLATDGTALRSAVARIRTGFVRRSDHDA